MSAQFIACGEANIWILLTNHLKFDLNDRSWSIYSRNMALAPHYVGQNAKITNSSRNRGAALLTAK